MGYSGAMKYFQELYETAQNKAIEAMKNGDVTKHELFEKQAGYALMAIESIKSQPYNDKNKEIKVGWNFLKSIKGRPIFMKEFNRATKEWFGWWDVVDSVEDDKLTTAYGETFNKEDKGKKWDAFDKIK